MRLPNAAEGSVKTVDRGLKIIEYLKDNQGSTLKEIAEAQDLAASTVHGHLTTMEQHTYVVKENGKYYLGMSFLHLGERARTRKKTYKMAQSHVESLAAETEERSQFVIEEHGRGVYLYKATGNRAVRAGMEIGRHLNLHTTAVGKTILANLPEADVKQIIDYWGLPPDTERSITDRDELFDELEEIQDQGYAINDEEHIEGLRGVGVSLKGKDDRIIGAISISGPTHRMTSERLHDELSPLLLGTVNELELNLAYPE